MPDERLQRSDIAFIDLQAQQQRLKGQIESAIHRVLEHGRYIMGPEVFELEELLSEFVSVEQCVTCASGTDALLMALMAWNIGPGDAVFVPTFTFASTAEVVALTGATPVFVDVSTRNFNMDLESLQAGVDGISDFHLRPAAVIPVDMFGHPADYEAAHAVAAQNGMKVLADSAQSFGATSGDRQAVSLGHIGATSFFPAKPLGCYGDGGALFTNDAETAGVLRSIRIHGQGSNKYDNVRVGINGRLDTIQAAILIQKLTVLDEELRARERVAARYAEGLSDIVTTPQLETGCTSAWAQYTVLCDDRDTLADHLRAAGIPTAIYYPQPLHRQPAYADFPVAPGGLIAAERLARHVLSLPMHPYLQPSTQDRIVEAVRKSRTQACKTRSS